MGFEVLLSLVFFCLCQVFIWIGRDANEVERTGSAKIGTISILKRAQLPLHKKAPWKKCRLFSSRSIFLSFQPATTWALTPLGGAIFPSPPSSRAPSRPPSLVGSRAGTPTCGTQTLWSASGPASKKPHARSLPTRKASPHNPCIPELEPARQRHQQANNGYNTASGWAYEQASKETFHVHRPFHQGGELAGSRTGSVCCGNYEEGSLTEARAQPDHGPTMQHNHVSLHWMQHNTGSLGRKMFTPLSLLMTHSPKCV